MISILYGIVIFIATLLGAFVGLGGGVIIKPVLDLINAHPLEQISFFSSCAVFAMSLTSTAKHLKNKTPIDKKVVLLIAAGSVVGGFLGNKLFHTALHYSSVPETVKGIQSVFMCLLLILVILSVNLHLKTYHLKNPVLVLLAGLVLGFIAAFLGIGGGPVNVALLTLLFSFSMKDAAVYSVAVIFFSQLSNLITTYADTGFHGYDVKVLPVILPCAVAGGLIGAVLNRKCSEKAIRTIFTIAVSSVALLSLYNAVGAWI